MGRISNVFNCFGVEMILICSWNGPVMGLTLKSVDDEAAISGYENDAFVEWTIDYIFDRGSSSEHVENVSIASALTEHPELKADRKITMQFTVNSKDHTRAIVLASNVNHLNIHKVLLVHVDNSVAYNEILCFQKNEIINTAVLSGMQKSLKLRIYSVTDGGSITDVTLKSQCISAHSRVLKVQNLLHYLDLGHLGTWGPFRYHRAAQRSTWMGQSCAGWQRPSSPLNTANSGPRPPTLSGILKCQSQFGFPTQCSIWLKVNSSNFIHFLNFIDQLCLFLF